MAVSQNHLLQYLSFLKTEEFHILSRRTIGIISKEYIYRTIHNTKKLHVKGKSQFPMK